MIQITELRQAMIKNPHHSLWNKDLNKWDDVDLQNFHNLKPKEKPKFRSGTEIRVIRVSDGKIYDSISDCRRKNNLCKVVMDRKIKEGIEFKKIGL